jgi:TonB-linked SusC/RagA family outer membrane protein
MSFGKLFASFLAILFIPVGVACAQQTGTIAGTVTDASTGEPLPGVNVLVKGTQQGTASNADGRFRIPNVAVGTYTLRASFIGFDDEVVEGVQVAVDELTEVNFELEAGETELDEVVVVGYGEQRKVNLTGSVSSVEGEELQDIPTARVDQTLQGRFAGVQVNQVSGEPGQEPKIRVRGSNSIRGNNEPLWVVDGIIAGRDFDLSNISSSDIESIEVLKDAVSLSIYGTRASNGVVLVTTKTGNAKEAGEMDVTFDARAGMQRRLEGGDFLNGPQHAAYANEDARFRGSVEPFQNPDQVANVNWIEEVTETAPLYNFDLSFLGTSESGDINYYNSANYFAQDGVIKSSGIDKLILRSNLDYTLSGAVRTGYRINIARVNRENNVVDATTIYRDILPERSIFDENGNYTAENPVTASIQANPVANLRLQTNERITTNILGTAYAEFDLITGLTLRSSISTEINNEKLNQYNPGALPENFIVNAGGDGSVDTYTGLNVLNENTVTYDIPDLGDRHDLDLLGGFTWQTFESEETSAQAFQFSTDVPGFNNLSFGTNPNRNIVNSDYESFQVVSWLQRTNYVLDNKYIFTFVGRVDGSSRFSEGNKYGFFPSGAVAWRLSQEPFIEDLGVFDLLKLRVSYGVTGSQAIGSFRTLPLLDAARTTFGGNAQSTVQSGRPANPDLTWETTNQLDIGLEAAFLDERLSFTADYFQKQTRDLLLNVQIPRQTGFTSRLQNLGELRNRGLELTVNTVNVQREDFQWTTRGTIYGNRNEVQDIGDVDFINIVDPSSTGQGGPGARLYVGQPAPVFVGVEYLGTWKSQDEIDASGQVGQDVGGPRFADQNGDGVISEEDFVVLGDPYPDFTYGLRNTLSYKNWSLSMYLQGTYGNDVFNSLTQTAFFGRPGDNKYKETLDRWTPDNRDSNVPRAGAVAAVSEVPNNSMNIEDGTHLRLKNLSLSYNLPAQSLGLSNTLKNARIYFSGSNLLLFSSFRLGDPEQSQFAGENIATGFSAGAYPSARTFTLGLSATF